MIGVLSRDLGLLVLRLGLGVTFVLHGSQKLFGAFGGGGLDGTSQMFEGLGLRPGDLFALLAGVGELGGGVLLVLGLLTPLGALTIAITMAVAIATTNYDAGFFTQGGGWEYNAVLIVLALGIMLLGPGRASLDALFGFDLGERLRRRRAASVKTAAGR